MHNTSEIVLSPITGDLAYHGHKLIGKILSVRQDATIVLEGGEVHQMEGLTFVRPNGKACWQRNPPICPV